MNNYKVGKFLSFEKYGEVFKIQVVDKILVSTVNRDAIKVKLELYLLFINEIINMKKIPQKGNINSWKLS